LQHLVAAEIEDVLGPRVYESYFKFAFVRNPYARLRSAYLGYYHHVEASFDRFIRKMVPRLSELSLEEDHSRHLKPQVSFIFRNDCELAVDFVGKHESLEDDIRSIEERTGVSMALESPPKVRGNRYRECFTTPLQRIVERVYAADFQAFGYTF
jgi:hypothetical protein